MTLGVTDGERATVRSLDGTPGATGKRPGGRRVKRGRTFDAPEGRPYAPTVAETSPVRGRWAIRHVPPTPRSIVELIRAGTLDAELAATLWLLIEGRVPLIVGARARLVGKSTLLDALLMFLPPGVRTVELDGAMETFDWLPHAKELGWRRPDGTSARLAAGTGFGRPSDRPVAVGPQPQPGHD